MDVLGGKLTGNGSEKKLFAGRWKSPGKFTYQLPTAYLPAYSRVTPEWKYPVDQHLVPNDVCLNVSYA